MARPPPLALLPPKSPASSRNRPVSTSSALSSGTYSASPPSTAPMPMYWQDTEAIPSTHRPANAGAIVFSISGKMLADIPLLPEGAEELNLSINTLSSLPAQLIPSLAKTLRVLDMESNDLQHLPPNIGSLSLLTELKLGRNALLRLPPTFSDLKALEVLDLSHNLLESLDPAIFVMMTHLRDLNLSYNQLRRLPSSLGLRGPSLASLQLHSLPLEPPLSHIAYPLLVTTLVGEEGRDLPIPSPVPLGASISASDSFFSSISSSSTPGSGGMKSSIRHRASRQLGRVLALGKDTQPHHHLPSKTDGESDVEEEGDAVEDGEADEEDDPSVLAFDLGGGLEEGEGEEEEVPIASSSSIAPHAKAGWKERRRIERAEREDKRRQKELRKREEGLEASGPKSPLVNLMRKVGSRLSMTGPVTPTLSIISSPITTPLYLLGQPAASATSPTSVHPPPPSHLSIPPSPTTSTATGKGPIVRDSGYCDSARQSYMSVISHASSHSSGGSSIPEESSASPSAYTTPIDASLPEEDHPTAARPMSAIETADTDVDNEEGEMRRLATAANAVQERRRGRTQPAPSRHGRHTPTSYFPLQSGTSASALTSPPTPATLASASTSSFSRPTSPLDGGFWGRSAIDVSAMGGTVGSSSPRSRPSIRAIRRIGSAQGLGVRASILSSAAPTAALTEAGKKREARRLVLLWLRDLWDLGIGQTWESTHPSPEHVRIIRGSMDERRLDHISGGSQSGSGTATPDPNPNPNSSVTSPPKAPPLGRSSTGQQAMPGLPGTTSSAISSPSPSRPLSLTSTDGAADDSRRDSLRSTPHLTETEEEGATDVEGTAEERAASRRSQRRVRIIEEILSTERTYVRELETLDRLYVQRSRAEGILTPEEGRAVFGDVGNLLIFHGAHLLPALEACVAEARASCDGHGSIGEARVGAIFAAHSAYIKMYSAYVNNMDRSVSAITSLEGRADWLRLVAAARADPSHTQLGLQGFLLLPVQRIPRYRMLLAELSRYTPPDHPNAPDLAIALEEMHRRAAEINERKRDFERGAQVLALQSRIRGAERIPLVQPHRRLIHQGTLRILKECRLIQPPVSTSTSKGSSTAASATSLPSLLGDPIVEGTLQERPIQKEDAMFILSDLIVQARPLANGEYDLVRSFPLPDPPHGESKAVEWIKTPGPLAKDENEAGLLRIRGSEVVLYAMASSRSPEDIAKWKSFFRL